MILQSFAQIDSTPAHDANEDTWQWLLAKFGIKLKPESFFDNYVHAVHGHTHTHTGMLKPEYEDLTATMVSMICANGYEHDGGEAYLYKNGSFYVRVVKL